MGGGYEETRSDAEYGSTAAEFEGSSGNVRVAPHPQAVAVESVRVCLPANENVSPKNAGVSAGARLKAK